MPNVSTRRSERRESFDFGDLVVRAKIDVQTVVALLGLIDGQEQHPWKSIGLGLNFKDRWIIVDNNPPERFAPPPAQRCRVRCGHHDLLPLKAH